MKRKGFTIIEFLIVVVIAGMLAVILLPSMRDPLERSRSRNAEFNLQSIYSAQKRYYLANRHYFNCSGIADPDERVLDINENLSIRINDPYFEYNITGDTDSYYAVATRKDGVCDGSYMRLTENNSTVEKIRKKGCVAW